MQFAFAELYQAKWSAKVELEFTKNVESKKNLKGKLNRTVELMRKAVPDYLATPTPVS